MYFFHIYHQNIVGWSGSAMALGNLSVPGRPTIWMVVGQGPTALAVGAGVGCLDILTLIYPFSPLYPSLWETARYRLKYCLKGPLSPKQPTNQKFKNEYVYSKDKFWTKSPVVKYSPIFALLDHPETRQT